MLCLRIIIDQGIYRGLIDSDYHEDFSFLLVLIRILIVLILPLGSKQG